MKRRLIFGMIFIVLFMFWTWFIQIIDVQPIGVNNTNVGFATLNIYFHYLIGIHMDIYELTDWLGLVPLFICVLFCMIGLIQWIQRRNLLKVDYDLLILGIYYVKVMVCYCAFERIPINYRPILIDGRMEISYPSSTTLLVLSVMPTLSFQVKRRIKNIKIKNLICVFTNIFSIMMVFGRIISGVHWLSDIIGAILLSIGLYLIYEGIVLILDKK